MKNEITTTELIQTNIEINNEKLVSVIIPCRNVSKWLPQCFLL